MRRILAWAVLCLAASAALAAAEKIQPLNAKTGLWQMTQTVKWNGLPPQMQQMMQSVKPTTTYKSCVRPKDLSSNPWTNGSGDGCHWTALNSNGTDMELQGKSCDMGKDWGMTADVDGKIHLLDSEHGTGSFHITMTGNGQTMRGHADYTGKWIGATCTKEVNN